MMTTTWKLQTITVDFEVPDCPTIPDPTRLPPLYYFGLGGLILVLLTLVVGVAMVRYNASDNQTSLDRSRSDNAARVLQERKTCGTCGGSTITDAEVEEVRSGQKGKVRR